MTGEMPPQGLLTATGFAAREALAVLRKHNIATAPLLLRAGLSEHGLARAVDEANVLPQRVSAIRLAGIEFEEPHLGRDAMRSFNRSVARRAKQQGKLANCSPSRTCHRRLRLLQEGRDVALAVAFVETHRHSPSLRHREGGHSRPCGSSAGPKDRVQSSAPCRKHFRRAPEVRAVRRPQPSTFGLEPLQRLIQISRSGHRVLRDLVEQGPTTDLAGHHG